MNLCINQRPLYGYIYITSSCDKLSSEASSVAIVFLTNNLFPPTLWNEVVHFNHTISYIIKVSSYSTSVTFQSSKSNELE